MAATKVARQKTPRKESLAHLADLDAVIDAAAYLFEKRGYTDTTMQDIADRIKISKPTLYKYSKSKNDILLMVIDQWMDRVDAALKSVYDLPTPTERFSVLVQEWAEIAQLRRSHLRVFLTNEQNMPPRAVKRYKAWSREVLEQFRAMVKEGQDAGEFRKDADPTVVAFSIIGFVLQLPRWLRPKGRLTPRMVAGEFLNNFLSGLKVRP